MHEKEKSSLCGNTSALPQVKNLQLELAAKEQENSQLITDIHQLQTSMNKMRDSELAKVCKVLLLVRFGPKEAVNHMAANIFAMTISC
jgi:cell division protein FtsB